MLTVILCAGKSQRFTDAGYKKQKAALPGPDGNAMLTHVVQSLNPTHLLLVFRKAHYSEFYHLMMNDIIRPKYGPKTTRHKWLKENTKSPFDTITNPSVASALEVQDELIVSYCDVIIPSGVVLDFIAHCRAKNLLSALCAFESKDKRFTTVPGHDKLKSSGLFYFKSGVVFGELVGRTRKAMGVPDIVYANGNFGVYDITDTDFFDVGTPEDYEKWRNKL